MIQIGQRAATIDTPIEHLMACHRRIEDRLTALEKAGERLGDDREAALAAIRNSMSFLDSSGAMHTADEEASLFPRLLPRVSEDEARYIGSLESQHRAADALHAELKTAIAGLAQDSRQDGRYRDLVSRLSAAYRSHIQSEDRVLTELARRFLDASQLQAISTEMRIRRNAK